MIPESIQQRLVQRPATHPRADRLIASGDIRRVNSGGESRLVLVLKVNADRFNAQISLVHPYSEYATENDLVIEPSLSGTSFPIVVQTAMRGVVWLKDLERLVSELPVEVVSACLGPVVKAPIQVGVSTGDESVGPLEARANFKVSERNALARLCRDCTEASLQDRNFVLDVDEVFHALLAPSPDADLMMSAIKDLHKTRGDALIFNMDHVDFLDSKGLLAVEKWERALGTEGHFFRLGPLQLLIDRAMACFGLEDREAPTIVGTKELVSAGQNR